MTRVVLIGAGGQARELFDLFADLNAGAPRFDVLGFLVEPPHGGAGETVRGRPILGDLSWLRDRSNEVQVICGVGDPALRRRLVGRARDLGAVFLNAIHPRAVLSGPVGLGRGVMIGAGTIVTGDVEVGDHVHVNTGCTISHDVVLGDFVTVSPGVHLAGGVRAGDGAFVGIGASVLPGRRLGGWSVVGAGCTVVRDVPDHCTVVGVPGQVIRRSRPGEGMP